MSLSESIRRGVMESRVGGIISKIKAHRRRYVLFFEEIIAEYIKLCEESGYEDEVKKISRKWAILVATLIVLPVFKKFPLILIMKISKRVWVNIGALNDLEISSKGNLITLKTFNEHVTRLIGKNSYAEGVFEGMLSVFSGHEIRCINKNQRPESCTYTFRIGKEFLKETESKEKLFYDRLNHSDDLKGVDFKNALKKKFFIMKKPNIIYFRGKSLIFFENTLFHLISQNQILMEGLSKISFNFFNDIVDRNSADERKLTLLKNLLQTMGWGSVRVEMTKKSVSITIKYPPYGLQKEKDNWEFLAMVILGYLRTMGKYSYESIKTSGKNIIMTFPMKNVLNPETG